MSLVSQRGLFPDWKEAIKGEKPRKKETYFDQVSFFCPHGLALKRQITECEKKKKIEAFQEIGKYQ